MPFRDSANGLFLFRQFSPAPCSPPLGGSIADSAVRFTPAVKYGGRENWPFRRETRCMSGHPCRAHHKLKWARKFGRYTRASVKASPTLREQHSCNRSKLPTGHIAAQTPQGQPCSTGVGNNPLTITKHSQRAVSRMPKARRSRLSLTRCAIWATLPRTSTTFHLLPPPAQIFPPALYYIADLLYSILTRKTNDKPIYAG